MPELPEVEIARRQLIRWLDGHRVVRAHADKKARTFRGADPKAFEKIRGPLVEAKRRGKYLMLAFGGGHGALMHLGMTGKFVVRRVGEPEPYSRAHLELEDGRAIHYRDPRLFGRIEPVPSAQLESLPVIQSLGVDPVVDGLSTKQLIDAVADSKQDLKVALMDQARIAGLGNIHAAEALFRSGIHPGRKPASLKKEEWTRLARAIHATLDYGIRTQEHEEEIEYVEEPGSPNPFRIYGREQCRKCGTKVLTFTQGGRTTHFCPTCQPKRRRSP